MVMTDKFFMLEITIHASNAKFRTVKITVNITNTLPIIIYLNNVLECAAK